MTFSGEFSQVEDSGCHHMVMTMNWRKKDGTPVYRCSQCGKNIVRAEILGGIFIEVHEERK